MFDFKSLVSSLLNKNTTASEVAQSATLLVRDLPEAEYFGALVEIIKAVAKINTDTEISLKERVKTLVYVDDKANNIHRQLCQDYLQSKGGSKGYLPTILAYWHELSTAYQICLRLYKSHPNAVPEDEIRIVTIRGYNYPTLERFWRGSPSLHNEEARMELLIKSVQKKLSDVAIVSELEFAAWARNWPQEAATLKLHPLVVTFMPTMCAVSPHSDIKVAQLNQAIDRLQKSGRIKTVLKTYQWQPQE